MKIIDNSFRVILFASALVLFGFGVYLSISDNASGATATYIAGIFSLIFVFLSSFQSFEGLGIKAKLLDQKIEESQAVIKKLQKTLVVMARTLFSLSSRTGRFDSGVSRIERYKLVEEIEKEFLINGISKEDINEAKIDWHRYNMIDLLFPIRERLQKIAETKKVELAKEFQAKFGLSNEDVKLRDNAIIEFENNLKGLFRFEDYTVMPNKLRIIIDSCIAIPTDEKEFIYNELKEEMSDVEYYAKKHEFRRLEVWLSKE